MNTIDDQVMRQCASYVGECSGYAEVHTVTMTLNGQHGGVDLKVEGFERADFNEEYVREFVIR